MKPPELPELPDWNFSVKETKAYALSYGRACMVYAAEIAMDSIGGRRREIAEAIRKAAEELK